MDFETVDPSLRRFGSGAVFKYHYPEVDFKILGCGIKTEQESIYLDFVNDVHAKSKLNKFMQQASIIVMHNAAYDLGCIKFIYKECKDIEKYLPTIHDTMLMAKLVKQSKKISYSLDALGKEYKCEHVKDSDSLHEYAWNSGLYQKTRKEKTGRNCHKRPSKAILEKFCKTNLDLFPTKIISEYCAYDVSTTWDLYHKLLPLLSYYDLTPLSKIIKICLKAKFRGVRLNLSITKKLSKQWRDLANKSKDEFLNAIGCHEESININSSDQIGPMIEKLGIKVPRTLFGKHSVTKEWLEEQGHPALQALSLYRLANKAEKDFIQKMIKYQEIIPEQYRKKDIGIMFPTLKPLGATLTGRFSSGGGIGSLELNILAISGRDEHFGLPIRELFLPYHDDEKIVCADFSNQEPRLQVHYAKLLNCDGVDEIIETWHENPTMKYHQKVADMTKLEYNIAKMLTLGLSYGMGIAKTAVQLNMPYPQAKAIIDQYHRLLPFMKQLQQATAVSLKKNGYIKTIGGRRLNIDAAYEFKGEMRTTEHKAMSKLIQGSGLDQLWQSMINIDEAGLNFMLCVHDEIIISSKQPETDKQTLVDCMQNAYKLVVPVIAEAGIGDNWFQSKP